MKIGYDPLDIKVVEEVIRKKELDIAAPKRQLKIPATHDPLTKEIEETEKLNNDMMKLIVEQSI